MTITRLIAEGVGDVPQWLADEGLELAIRYFENADVDPIECFNSKKDKEMSQHWNNAEKEANRVLKADPRYDYSMINLDIETVDEED